MFIFMLYQITRTIRETNEKNESIYVDKIKNIVTARFYKVRNIYPKKTDFKGSCKYQHLIYTNDLRLIKNKSFLTLELRIFSGFNSS